MHLSVALPIALIFTSILLMSFCFPQTHAAPVCLNSTTNGTLLPNICQPVTPYLFFYDADLLAIPEIQAAVLGIVEVAKVARAVVPRSCATQLVGIYCAQFYGECNEFGLPRAPCNSMCTSMVAACAGPLAAAFAAQPAVAAALLPNCSALEADPFRVGVAKFPAVQQLWRLAPGVAFNVTCLAEPLTSSVHVNAPVYSPWAMYGVNETQDVGLTCPVQFYSLGTYRAIKYMTVVVGCISFVVASFVALNTLFVPSFRKFPASLTTMLLVVSAYASFSYVIQTIWGFENTLCTKGRQPASQSHFPCGAQGWFSVTGTLSLALYWLFVGINMWLAVARGKVLTDVRVEVFVHVISVGLPLLLAGIVFGKKKIRNDGGASTQCFIETFAPGASDPDLSWIWGCWAWVILLCLLGGTGVLGMVIYHLRGISALRVHLRILLFLGWKWLNLFFAVLNVVLWNTVHTKDISRDFTSFAVCRLGKADCAAGRTPNEPLIVISVLTYVMEGLLIGLLIGSSSEMRDHWWGVLARVSPSLAPEKYSVSIANSHNTTDRPSRIHDSNSQA